MKRIFRLPRLEGTKQLSPYDQLYHFIAKRLGMPWEKFRKTYNVYDIAVCEATGKLLEGKQYAWERKTNKTMDAISFGRAFVMQVLNYAPAYREGIQAGKVEVEVKEGKNG